MNAVIRSAAVVCVIGIALYALFFVALRLGIRAPAPPADAPILVAIVINLAPVIVIFGLAGYVGARACARVSRHRLNALERAAVGAGVVLVGLLLASLQRALLAEGEVPATPSRFPAVAAVVNSLPVIFGAVGGLFGWQRTGARQL